MGIEGATERRVLVVEDDADVREAVAAALTDGGYAVRAVPDGRTAFAVLEAWRPDVVVLDLVLPGKTGWEFRDLQRASPALAAIPVIVMTALSDLPPVLENLNPAAHLAKPFDIDVLLATVGAAVGGRASRP